MKYLPRPLNRVRKCLCKVISSLTNSFFPLVQGKKGTKSEESTVGKKLGGKSQKAGAEHCLQKATTSDYK